MFATKLLLRHAYKLGRNIETAGQRPDLEAHVSTVARRKRHANSSFAGRHYNIFVWVLRLIVLCQQKAGVPQVNTKTMSKYAHKLAYAQMHKVHHDWLLDFLKTAGSDQEISRNLQAGRAIKIEKLWLKPKS